MYGRTVAEEDELFLERCKKCANYVESYAERPNGYMRCLVWSYDPKIDGCRFFREPQPLSTKKAIEYIKKSMPTESLTKKKLAEYSEARTMAIQALETIDKINTTNGNRIKIIFPNAIIKQEYDDFYHIDIVKVNFYGEGESFVEFSLDWWNSPWEKEKKNE